MRKAGMLRRRMKFDVSDIDSRSHRHSERLNGAIEVLVIEGVFIVPHAATQVGYFVTNKEDAVIAWSRLDLIYRRAIAPVQAMMAGCSRTVAPVGLKLKLVGPPLTLCCW